MCVEQASERGTQLHSLQEQMVLDTNVSRVVVNILQGKYAALTSEAALLYVMDVHFYQVAVSSCPVDVVTLPSRMTEAKSVTSITRYLHTLVSSCLICRPPMLSSHHPSEGPYKLTTSLPYQY